MRLIDFVSLNLRLKDLLGPVTRVKKKKKVAGGGEGRNMIAHSLCNAFGYQHAPTPG